MACYPEQPFTAAQEERIREIIADQLNGGEPLKLIDPAEASVRLRNTIQSTERALRDVPRQCSSRTPGI